MYRCVCLPLLHCHSDPVPGLPTRVPPDHSWTNCGENTTLFFHLFCKYPKNLYIYMPCQQRAGKMVVTRSQLDRTVERERNKARVGNDMQGTSHKLDLNPGHPPKGEPHGVQSRPRVHLCPKQADLWYNAIHAHKPTHVQNIFGFWGRAHQLVVRLGVRTWS